MERLRAYWLELSVRERQIVLGGAIAVLVMVLYAVIWQPVLDARARLLRVVPRQAQSLAQIRQLVQTVRPSSASAMSAEIAVNQAAKAASIDVPSAQLQGSQRIRLQFLSIDFAKWLAFADSMRRNGWQVEMADLVAEPSAGKVRVLVEFGH